MLMLTTISIHSIHLQRPYLSQLKMVPFQTVQKFYMLDYTGPVERDLKTHLL